MDAQILHSAAAALRYAPSAFYDPGYNCWVREQV